MIPVRLRDAVADWVAEMDTGLLAEYARSSTSLMPEIRRKLGRKAPLLRFVLNLHEQQAIRTAGRAEWDEVLTYLIEQVPTHGVILWQHQAWYHAQMTAIQGLVVQELPSADPAPSRYTSW